MTSSFAAVGYSAKAVVHWTEEDWTDPDDDNTAYIRSKVLAERAAWNFLDTEGGELELTTLVPVGVFGPTLGTQLSTSVRFIQSMLAGAVNGWLLGISASRPWQYRPEDYGFSVVPDRSPDVIVEAWQTL
ncbi:MAG: NAD-dependent epimerase/dehydratase family protein [Actinomycetota bacterium]